MYLLLSLIISLLNPSNSTASCALSVDPISCYLNSLVITFPNSICHESKNDTTTCINNLTCFDLNISKINSSYVSPTSLNLFGYGIQANCNSSWNHTYLFKPLPASGKASIYITDLITEFDLNIHKDAITHLPTEASLISNFYNFNITSTVFEIDKRNQPEPEKGPIENGIVDVMTVLLSDIVPKLLDEFMSHALTLFIRVKLNPKLIEIIRYTGSVPPIMIDQVDWAESSLIRVIDSFVSLINKVWMSKVSNLKNSFNFQNNAQVSHSSDKNDQVYNIIDDFFKYYKNFNLESIYNCYRNNFDKFECRLFMWQFTKFENLYRTEFLKVANVLSLRMETINSVLSDLFIKNFFPSDVSSTPSLNYVNKDFSFVTYLQPFINFIQNDLNSEVIINTLVNTLSDNLFTHSYPQSTAESPNLSQNGNFSFYLPKYNGNFFF
jgi:hypothetical protein